MYHISKSTETKGKTRWVLLEHLPPILSPKILLLIFLYATAFTLLLLGLKMLHLEHKITYAGSQLTSNLNHQNFEDTLLYQQDSMQQMQKDIASQIIRLHVIANSDREDDQKLKLKVRDAIIRDLQKELSDAGSISQARSIILSQIPQIQETARKVIQQEGYDYNVTVSLGTRYFPVKVYGDLSFPAGDYEALCLEIGTASGHNWWCVLFPSLCFVDETYAVVPEESKERLKSTLSQEEYEALQEPNFSSAKNNNSTNDTPVKFHSAIYDWLTEEK